MKKIDIITMGIDKNNNSPVVFLKIENTNLIIPIWIGNYEATLLTAAIKNEQFFRPLTHDLIISILEKVDVPISYIVINDFKDNTYFAKLVLDEFEEDASEQKKLEIDSRPSDAIVLAVKAKIPIYVDESVAVNNAIDGSFLKLGEEDAHNERMDNIKKFVDNFNIDDLKKQFNDQEEDK